MLKKSVLIVALALGLISCAAPDRAVSANDATSKGQPFSFGLWGDMPYKKAGDDAKLPAVLSSINAADIAFSIYDGDIKDGSSKCSDSVYTDALAMFNSMARPVVYVPGDNEWTDCHRLNNGGMDALERLSHVRKVMYPTPMSLGKAKIPLAHQGALGEKYVENTRFDYGGVVFVGINMPGSNNNQVMDAKSCTNKSARTTQQCDAANAEYLARDAANVSWLEASFAQAKAHSAYGLVVVVQGDPGFDLPETEDHNESSDPGVSGYRNFIAQLVKQTEQFSGQVLLVHGDTHFFKLDKPLYAPGKPLANLTRLQTFGSPSLHWVRVTVDPTTSHLFQVQPVMVSHRPL